jgi:hypothetical protein
MIKAFILALLLNIVAEWSSYMLRVDVLVINLLRIYCQSTTVSYAEQIFMTGAKYYLHTCIHSGCQKLFTLVVQVIMLSGVKKMVLYLLHACMLAHGCVMRA